MKKIVVSLKKSGRRENFDKLFSGLGHEYFEAIVPENNDPRFEQFIAKSLYGRELRKGEVGCTLSHFEIIKKFCQVNDGSEWLLVMEDDALPEKHFHKFMSSFHTSIGIHDNIPKVILLGHSKTSKKNIFIQRLTQPLAKKTVVNGFAFGQNKNVSFCGTVCYLINKQAACIISECKVPYWMADDWTLFCKLGVSVLHPFVPLVYEDLSYASSTGNVVFQQHDFFKRPKTTLKEIIIGQCKFYNNY